MTTPTPRQLRGTGFEFCNCQGGCTSCNFSGFPSSADGSCKAAALTRLESGRCGDLDLSAIDALGILDWPKAIPEGGGRAVFVVPPGVGRAQGTTLKNPVTGEDHRVAIELDQGFVWKRGDCGQGSFEVAAEGIRLQFADSNWIRYRFDWTNRG